MHRLSYRVDAMGYELAIAGKSRAVMSKQEIFDFIDVGFISLSKVRWVALERLRSGKGPAIPASSLAIWFQAARGFDLGQGPLPGCKLLKDRGTGRRALPNQ